MTLYFMDGILKSSVFYRVCYKGPRIALIRLCLGAMGIWERLRKQMEPLALFTIVQNK